MPLNTFIDLLDRIASAWEGYKVMADHIRKVSAGRHGNQYYSAEKGREKIQKSGKNRSQDSEKWEFYFEIVTEGFVKFMNEI